MLSYQHAFHAGNRADVLKHAVLHLMLREAARGPAPLMFIDTHSGRADYDLNAQQALKKAEHLDGVLPLLALVPAIPELAPWLETVRAWGTRAEGLARYPGSPRLAALTLRANDRLVLFERHPAEHEALAKAFEGDPRARVVKGDGFTASLTLAPRRGERLLVHVDPSYETAQDMSGLLAWLDKAERRWPGPVSVAVWLPHFRDGRESAFCEALCSRPETSLLSARWPASASTPGSALTGSAMWLSGVGLSVREDASRIAAALEAFWASSEARPASTRKT